jgi:hypothetical protein
MEKKLIMVCMALVGVLCIGTLSAQEKFNLNLFEGVTQEITSENESDFKVCLAEKGTSSEIYYADPNGNVKKATVETPFPPTPVGSGSPYMQCFEYIDGELYAIRWSEDGNELGKVDMTNGAWTEIGAVANCDGVSLCYNPVDGLTYVFPFTGENSGGKNWGTIDLATGALTVKGNMGSNPTMFVAINNEGVAYANVVGTNQLGIVDLETGAFTQTHTLPFTTQLLSNMSFDRETGLLYWMAQTTAANYVAYFYEIDLTAVTLKQVGLASATHWAAFTTITTGEPVNFCPEVTNLNAELQGTDVKLTWTAAEGSPTGYKIYKGSVELGTVTTTEYVVRNLSNGTYTFAVAAIYDDCTPKKVTKEATVKPGKPVRNLNGNCNDGTLTLTWDEPDAKGSREDEIVLDLAGKAVSAIGYNGNPHEMWPVNRYTPEDLEAFGVTAGMELTTVSIFLYQSSISPAGTFTVKVWQGGHWGAAGDRDPGTELVSQLVSLPVIYGQWRAVTLDIPIKIDVTKELWIGYQAQVSSGSPCGVGAPPEIYAKGNVTYDGSTSQWVLLPEMNTNLKYNWCIRGTLVSQGAVITITNYDIYQDDIKFGAVNAPATTFTKTGVTGTHDYCIVAVYENDAQSQKVCKMLECGACEKVTGAAVSITETQAVLTWNAVEGATGYEISRGGNLLTTLTAPATTYTETGEFAPATEYKWQIVTLCGNGKSDAVEVGGFLGINDMELSKFTVIPNPAQDYIQISAGVNFNKVEVINFLGQTVISQSVGAMSAQIDISNLTGGVYFVRVVTETGTSVKKFVKQ